MAGYNITRYVEELLEQHKSSPPSFAVHLYPDHFTLNQRPKPQFLYNGQMAPLLDDIRAQRIPTDLLEILDASNVPFYDGCLIAELLDYRPPKGKDPILEKPACTRVVLCPTPESLWADICLLNQKAGNTWSDEDALEVEARILVATAPPICLEPDIHLTRIANNILRASVPTAPASLKRKAAVMEQEEEETEKARRIKIAQFMNPHINSSMPTKRVSHFLEEYRKRQQEEARQREEGKEEQVAREEEENDVKPKLPPVTISAGFTVPRLASVPEPITIPDKLLGGSFGLAPSLFHPTAYGNTAPPRQPTLPLQPQPPVTGSGTIAPASLTVSNNLEKKMVRQSPRPPSTVPAPAIPLHMQALTAVRNTPSPSQTPRPPSTVPSAIPAHSPVMRPPSIAQSTNQAGPSVQPQTQSLANQPAHAPATVPQSAQQQRPMQGYPAAMMNYLQAQAQQQKKNGGNPAQAAANNAMLYNQYLQQQAAVQAQAQAQAHAAQQARLSGAGTPMQQGASPVPQAAMAVNQAIQQQQQQQQQQQAQQQQQQQQRNSPLAAANQAAASRSPMPMNPQAVPQMNAQNYAAYAQLQAHAAQAQAQAAQAHKQQPQFRPVMPGHAPHPQMVAQYAAAAANGGAAAQVGGMMPQQGSQAGQDQNQAHAAHTLMATHYPAAVYNYPQMMNMQAGRVGPYWPMGMGRGMPAANMVPQHNQQQVQLGAGKTMPGGMQGT